MSARIFCNIVSGQLPAQKVYEDDQLPGIPERHTENLNSLTAEDTSLMTHRLLTLAEIAAANGLPGFRTITNTGKEGGQEVFHMHFHIPGGQALPGFN